MITKKEPTTILKKSIYYCCIICCFKLFQFSSPSLWIIGCIV